MATVESYEMIKGTVNGDLSFHFDVANDVLYLRQVSSQGQEVFGEETPEGLTVFRTENDTVAGLTIIDFWKRFGVGQIGDVTLQGLRTSIEARVNLLPQALAA